MKRYIRSNSGNSHAVDIANNVFGNYWREDYRVKIFKQTNGYSLKYYADDRAYANKILNEMIQTAQELGIDVLRSNVKPGFLQHGGSYGYHVASILVPAV